MNEFGYLVKSISNTLVQPDLTLKLAQHCTVGWTRKKLTEAPSNLNSSMTQIQEKGYLDIMYLGYLLAKHHGQVVYSFISHCQLWSTLDFFPSLKCNLDVFCSISVICSTTGSSMLNDAFHNLWQFQLFLISLYLILLHQGPEVEHVRAAFPGDLDTGLGVLPGGGIAAVQFVTYRAQRKHPAPATDAAQFQSSVAHPTCFRCYTRTHNQ